MDQVREDDDRRRRKERGGKGRKRKRKRTRKRRERGFEDEALAPGDPGYRDAADLAEKKIAFIRDAVVFGFWTTLALVFVFPLGVILLIFGAPKRVRRFSRLYIEPGARDQLTRAELEKRARRNRGPASRPPAAPPEGGQAPPAPAHDRAALEELDRVERELRARARLRLTELDVAQLLETALDELGDRISLGGVSVEQRLDGVGTLRGDADKLQQALVLVLAQAIDALEGGATPSPRIDVDMGQNLAGSAVWIRVRDNGPEGGRSELSTVEQLVDALGGELERAAEPAGGIEVLITLPRRAAAGEV